MRKAEVRDNCHTVWMAGEALCVECRACRHRAALTSPQFHRGNMKELRGLNLRCRQCQAGNVALFLPASIKEAEDWARGVDRSMKPNFSLLASAAF